MIIVTIGQMLFSGIAAAQLKAGIAKVNITGKEGKGLVNDSLYVKVLALDDGTTRAVIACLDARAIGGKGPINNDFLGLVRSQIQKDLNIKPENVLITATGISGGRLCSDLDKRTDRAVKIALQNMVAVNIGVGTGYEDRIMENRRLRLTNGKEWTIRGANPLPPDEDVVGIRPVDPKIGILRLDKKNGKILAVVYNFACHPYQGFPNKGVTADLPGFASKVIEDNLSESSLAIFLHGCLGDITTVLYKDVNNPKNAEPLDNMLVISTLQALKKIKSSKSAKLKIINEIIELPLRTDVPQRIESLETEQARLLKYLQGTSLNLKMFIPLYVKYNFSPEFPS